MPSVSEQVLIEATPERVWGAVHEDLENAPRWSPQLRRASAVRGRPGRGWVVRYELALPGWSGAIEVTHDVWSPRRRCAGRFTRGPLEGDWAYEYRARGNGTAMSYRMQFELSGFMRLLGGMLAGQYAAGIREQMAELKVYLEDSA